MPALPPSVSAILKNMNICKQKMVKACIKKAFTIFCISTAECLHKTETRQIKTAERPKIPQKASSDAPFLLRSFLLYSSASGLSLRLPEAALFSFGNQTASYLSLSCAPNSFASPLIIACIESAISPSESVLSALRKEIEYATDLLPASICSP